MMPGWVAEADGTPIMEDRPLPEGHLVLPLGGTREIGSHKGYSLLLMIEIMTSILAGGGGGPLRDRPSADSLNFENLQSFF